MEKTYVNLKKLKTPTNEAEYELEIPVAVLERESEKLVAEAAKDFKKPGFRPGKAPLNIVRESLDKIRLLEDAAEVALRLAIKELIVDEKISALGMPRVTLQKIALGNPVSFKIKFGLVPEVKLPDYRKIGGTIAKREDNLEPTEEELSEALKNIQKMVTPGPGGGKDPEKLPELNDDFAKQLGPFENLEAFKTEIRKQIREDKKINAKNAKRDEMLKSVVKEAKIGEVSPLLLEEEYENYLFERDEALKKAEMTLEEYLKQVKKTAEELEKEMKEFIKERIKTRLVVRAIQEKEKLEADHDEIHQNMERLKRRYPDKDSHYLHQMAELMILNDKLFRIFEGEEENK